MAPIPSSLVAILLVKSKVYFLTLNGQFAIFDFDMCHPCTWATRVSAQWHRLNIG
jgi:hypothetical protein